MHRIYSPAASFPPTPAVSGTRDAQEAALRPAPSTLLLASLLVGSMFAAGCSRSAGSGPTPSDDSSGFQTGVRPTAAGAMTGAALGMGLGAIIGSTSGDAGAGVAIGGASGALVGAGIGYQIEGQEKALSNQRESIERQEQQIAAQRNEIDLLRASTKDPAISPGREIAPPRGSAGSSSRVKPVSGYPSSSRTGATSSTLQGPRASMSYPSAGAGSASGFGIQEGYRGSPRAKPYGASEKRPAGWGPTAAVGKASMKGSAHAAAPIPASVRLDRAPVEQPRAAARPTAAAAPAAVGAGAAGTEQLIVGSKTGGLPPANLTAPDETIDLGAAHDDVVDTGLAAGLDTDHDPAANVANFKPASAKKAAPSSSPANCEQAAREAERGLNAGSTADRLFYLKRAAQLCPAEPTYHLELGRSYSEVGKKKDAVVEFRQAIDLDPDNQMARDELSMLENSAGGTTRQ